MALLETSGLTKYFGGLAALNDVSLQVQPGEILGIIGPNGSGKTTLFNVVTGYHRLTSGSVMFDGHDITGLAPNRIAKRGLARTFQGGDLFKSEPVIENMRVAHYLHTTPGVWSYAFGSRASRRTETQIEARSQEILEFTGLMAYRDRLAGELSSGYQKTLTIAMALATGPKLLLLDEPVTTLTPTRVETIMQLIARVRANGTTVVVIEHNMRAIMDYCDRILVLAYGRMIADGRPHEIRENSEVIEAYLGKT